MQTISVPHGEVQATRPIGRVRSRAYLALALFMAALVVVGFWPTYFGRLLRGDVARPLVVQLHGIVFVGWMALLVAQVALVVRGRTDLHRRVGRLGIAYGWLVLTMGVVVGIAAPVMHVSAGEWTRDRGAGFLLVTLGDVVLFGALFGAAVAYRSRPDVHKRLMLAATTALLFAAVGRMEFIIASPALLGLVWLSPMLIGIAHDWVTRRRVHLAYLIGTALLFLGATRIMFEQSAAWLSIGRPMIDALVQAGL
jgi:hypothetical protein